MLVTGYVVLYAESNWIKEVSSKAAYEKSSVFYY